MYLQFLCIDRKAVQKSTTPKLNSKPSSFKWELNRRGPQPLNLTAQGRSPQEITATGFPHADKWQREKSHREDLEMDLRLNIELHIERDILNNCTFYTYKGTACVEKTHKQNYRT